MVLFFYPPPDALDSLRLLEQEIVDAIQIEPTPPTSLPELDAWLDRTLVGMDLVLWNHIRAHYGQPAAYSWLFDCLRDSNVYVSGANDGELIVDKDETNEPLE